jgi:hypothetical protein
MHLMTHAGIIFDPSYLYFQCLWLKFPQIWDIGCSQMAIIRFGEEISPTHTQYLEQYSTFSIVTILHLHSNYVHT